MKEIINIAVNAPKMNCILAPVSNDHDLGNFYVENEFLPQLSEMESLTDEQYEWMCSRFDFAKIGREVRGNEQGAFVGGGYIILNEDIKELYNGNPVIPKPVDYVFLLEIAVLPTGDEPNDDHTITLNLPATQSQLQEVLDTLGVSQINECCFYGYESPLVRQLAECFGDMEDVDTLNELATQIKAMDTNGLILYKAMTETVKCSDIQTAIEVSKQMENFTLDKGCMTPTEYADKVLESIDFPLKEKLLPHFPTYEYGKALLEERGIDSTSYGMLIPNDGIKLSEQLQRKKDCLEMTMSM